MSAQTDPHAEPADAAADQAHVPGAEDIPQASLREEYQELVEQVRDTDEMPVVDTATPEDR